MRKRLLFCLLFLLMGPLGYSARPTDFPRITHPEKLAQPQATATRPEDPMAKERAIESLAEAPLLFMENKGQLVDDQGNTHPEILFMAKSRGAQVYITATGIHYVFSKQEATEKAATKPDAEPKRFDPLTDVKPQPVKTSVERFTLSLMGANTNSTVQTGEAGSYFENYYLAHCPQGVTARTFEKITIKQVYPGVDWVIYSHHSGMKYDFVLAKASLASQIKLKVTGAIASINDADALVMQAKLGTVLEEKPVSYQQEQQVPTRFVIRGDNEFGFELEGANDNLPLTIDPSIVWSTYYGVGREDNVKVQVDADGNIYMAGIVDVNMNLYPTQNAFQPNKSVATDLFAVKFNAAGTPLWATYYGGGNHDYFQDIALDQNANLVLTGYTPSHDFPVANAYQSVAGGSNDAFLVVLNSNGGRQWATYIGGQYSDEARACTADAFGNYYVTGHATSPNFPLLNAFSNAMPDAFLLKFSSNGTLLISSFLNVGGGTGFTCSTDAAGNVIIGGFNSTSFVTQNAFQPANATYGDGFLVKLTSTGTVFWSTFFGGSAYDEINASAVDSNGDIYIIGSTESPNFPVRNAYQTTRGGGRDAYVAKFSSTGGLLFSTYLGGSGHDYAYDCAVDLNGGLYITGRSGSNNFPTLDVMLPAAGGVNDVFVTRVSSTGQLTWSTCFGSSAYNLSAMIDVGRGCAVDPSGNIIISGLTGSTDFPAFNSFQSNHYLYDTEPSTAFLLKASPATATYGPLVVESGLSETASGYYTSITVKSGATLAMTGNVFSAGPVTVQSGAILKTEGFRLFGKSTFTMSAGSIIEIKDRFGINLNNNNFNFGAIQTSGTRTYASDATFIYNGTSRQGIGSGLPATVSHLVINNSAGVDIDNLGNSSQLVITRTLTLGSGVFTFGQNLLNLASNSNGTAMVINSGGTSNGFTMVHRYLNPVIFSGIGDHYISAPVTGQFLAGLENSTYTFLPVLNTAYNTAPNPGAVRPYPNVMAYDFNRTTAAATGNGWYVPNQNTIMGSALGYSVKIKAGTSLQYSGQLFNGNRTVTGNNTTAQALFLLGNPYPSPIDWNLIGRTRIYNSYYTWQPTGSNVGRYASYVNGVGTNGATNIIPMGLGFFVSTSGTSPQLAFTNACRLTTYTNPSTFRQQEKALLRLRLNQVNDTVQTNETVIYFDSAATSAFNGELDARHLGGQVALFSQAVGQSCAIKAQPTAYLNDGATHNFAMGYTAPAAGIYTITASEMTGLSNQTVVLIDNVLNNVTLLQPGQGYTFSAAAGTNASRFVVQLNPAATGAKASLSSQLSIYPNPAKDRLEVSGLGSQASIRLLNSIGQQVVTTTASFSAMLDIEALAAGVYTLQIEQDGQVVNQRVVKQ